MTHTQRRLSLLTTIIFVLSTGALAQGAEGSNCPVTTVTSKTFEGPFSSSPHMAWFGSEALAVFLNTSGEWRGMGPEYDYRDKQWWWSYGYSPKIEPKLDLMVSGHRLDADAPPAEISEATTGFNDAWNGWTMLVGVEFPSSGCWEITGKYRGQTLTFIVQVFDEEPQESAAPNSSLQRTRQSAGEFSSVPAARR